MSVWKNKEFADFWNSTYGLDMAKAPIRPGVIYPLLESKIWSCEAAYAPTLRLIDFGCGNGNLIRAFKDKPFAEWVGVDNGDAILETATYLKADKRIRLMNEDIGQEIAAIRKDGDFDHAMSVFTLEEIPFQNMGNLFANLAAAVSKREGLVHVFTQHPAYALQQDWIAYTSGQPNAKFFGHKGYFDTSKTSYCLSTMNAEAGYPEMIDYHHKTLVSVMNAVAEAGLCLRQMIEVPSGVSSMEDLAGHQPKSGDVPRFLYLEAGFKPLGVGRAKREARGLGL